jgi:MinD-like ATPase involved in chromosome partitioning or flagellar assembly
MEKRLNIFTGHFGSGKSEIAINYALRLKKKYKKVVIVDMDIVNPYFRTNDVKEMLNKKGINVISSIYANSNIDLPAIPAEVMSIFQDKEAMIVLDIGGDDIGAIVLGRYNKYIIKEDYNMFFVINIKRPLTMETGDIEKYIKDIEMVSRVKITGLINNTNILNITETADIEKGHNKIKEVSENLGIPIEFITGKKELLENLPDSIKKFSFPIDIYLNPPW